MRVGLDLRWWQESAASGRPNGIATYTKGLATALVAAPGEDRFVLVLSDGIPDPPEVSGLVASGRAGVARVPRTWLARRGPWSVGVACHLVRERLTTARLATGWGLDVWHAPAHFVPPPAGLPCAMVTTIHDLIYLRYPGENLRTFAARWAFRRLLARAIRSDRVLADSSSVAGDMVSLLGVPPERIVVSYPGIAPVPLPAWPRLGSWFLHVGGVTLSKNVLGLIEGYVRFLASNGGVAPPLRLAGTPGRGRYADRVAARIAMPDLVGHVERMGVVDQVGLDDLYAGAIALVYPSIAEGFGLPVLEAMARGVPVIAGRAASIPEVVGDAAILVDPSDPDAIAQALAQVHDSPDLCQDLARRGVERARAFSWARTAEVAIATYRGAAAVDPRP